MEIQIRFGDTLTEQEKERAAVLLGQLETYRMQNQELNRSQGILGTIGDLLGSFGSDTLGSLGDLFSAAGTIAGAFRQGEGGGSVVNNNYNTDTQIQMPVADLRGNITNTVVGLIPVISNGVEQNLRQKGAIGG